MESGIYSIENLINGKKYIGQTTNFYERKSNHFSALKNNKHKSAHLQNAFNKYGEKGFVFKILIFCEHFELTRYEQFFIDLYTPKILYNIRLECVDNNSGIIFSEEAKKKNSESHKGEKNWNYGKHHSEETIKKMSIIKKGKIFSEEHLKNLSESHKGKAITEETRKKLSRASTGKKHSEKTRRRLSEVNTGKHLSEKTKNKISKIQKGRKASEETKKRMSETHKKYWAQRRI